MLALGNVMRSFLSGVSPSLSISLACVYSKYVYVCVKFYDAKLCVCVCVVFIFDNKRSLLNKELI